MKDLFVIIGLLSCIVIPAMCLHRRFTIWRRKSSNAKQYMAFPKRTAATIAAIGALSLSAFAQQNITNSIPQSIADVSGSLTKWLTSYDTNATTFSNTKLDLWTAMNYQKGINTSAEIGLSYDVYKPVSVEAVFRNVGVGGDLLSYSGGVGYNIVKYDVKLTGYLDVGNNQFDRRTFLEVGARIKKALTAHSYTFFGIGLQKEFGSHAILTPTITAGAGVTL